MPGANVTCDTVWRNTAAGHLPFKHTPALYLLDKDGIVRSSALNEKIDPTTWLANKDQRVAFDLKIPNDLKSGDYTLAVALVDVEEKPGIALGIEGDDGHKRFVLGTVAVSGK